MNKQETDNEESDDQEMSECRQDYIRRWMERELRMQQASSDRFLRGRNPGVMHLT